MNKVLPKYKDKQTNLPFAYFLTEERKKTNEDNNFNKPMFNVMLMNNFK